MLMRGYKKNAETVMESTFLGCFSGSMIRVRIYVFQGIKIGFENPYRQIAMTSAYSSNLPARFFCFFKMVGLAGEGRGM